MAEIDIEGFILQTYQVWDDSLAQINLTGLSPEVDHMIIATGLLLAVMLVLKIVFSLFQAMAKKMKDQSHLGINIRGYQLIHAEQVARVTRFLIRITHNLLRLAAVYLYVVILLGSFPEARGFAVFLLKPAVEAVLYGAEQAVNYIPNLFAIGVIIFITHYVLKFLHMMSQAIATRQVTFPGFFHEWADPTEKILKFVIIMLTIVLIAPYLPGFDSPAFKGVSVFLGVLLSLGSTAAVANVVAGCVLIYMRAFTVGDRVQVGQIEGEIQESTLLITRIKTPKNRVITIPNGLILANPVINLSTLAKTTGVILHTTVTIGYDVPWRNVHELLLEAVSKTQHTLDNPKPFILQNSLGDYSVTYELNAYIEDVARMPAISSELHQNIQDIFERESIEILSPAYTAVRDGNDPVIPKEPLAKPELPHAFKLLNLKP